MKVKNLLIAILAIVLLFALGWVSFQQTDTDANIRIDKQEIREDTGKVIEKGKELINDAQEAIDESTTPDRDAMSPEPTPNDGDEETTTQ